MNCGKEKESTIKPDKRQKKIPVLPFLFVWFFAVCFTCEQNGQEKYKPGISDDERWFELKEGNLVKVDDPRNIKPGSLLPWSVQERITGIALFRNTLCFSVNGYGILACSSLKAGQTVFKTHYNHQYFKNKTITTILPVYETINGKDEYILCHLYFNVMVYPFNPDDTLFDNANIIKLTPGGDELVIEELYPAPPEEVPHWEIVGFLPVNKEIAHLEWKNSQNNYTEFRYSYFSVKQRKEEEENREDFLNAYNFTPLTGDTTPKSLRFICEKIMADVSRKTDYTTFHFLIKEKISHITRRYIKTALVPMTHEKFEIIAVSMFEDELGYYALAESGFVYFMQQDDMEIRQIDLPHLPEGFHYTGFFVHDNTLILSWEESVFMNVGASGLLFFRDDLLF